MKAKKPTRKELEYRILELNAQLVHVYHFADATLDGAGKRLLGSGVLLRLNGLGGKELINPMVIRDGLSDETIAAIRKDIQRSYELATLYKPKIG